MMSQYRIQNQIAVYKTNKKLVEFNDKLKAAPVEYYGHIHAQGEKLNDGSRPRSCIGMILQDYSKGTGENTIRVMANLSPEFFTYALSRVKIGAPGERHPCPGSRHFDALHRRHRPVMPVSGRKAVPCPP